MQFSVGYQLFKNSDFIKCIIQNKEKISEYFSASSIPNGRNTDYILNDFPPFEAEEKKINDLKEINDTGIKLNLLLNGNCYGKYALARSFYNKLGDTIDHLNNKFGLSVITTTSPLIAKFVKENFQNINVRASVNMGIDGIDGMEYIKNLFDEFYLKREYNRDIRELKAARKWCNINGKKLFGLANSGCLNFCSAHTFHDNLVAHEGEVSEMDNRYVFSGQCFDFLEHSENRDLWLRRTNFIRPEDVHLYEEYFDGLKLATRVNFNPQKIVTAYTKGSYKGNIPDILEPNHSGLFFPSIIENEKIPVDFGKKIMTCDKNCNECNYCKNVLKSSLINLE